MTNTRWFLVFTVRALCPFGCRSSCLWTLQALIMEEYFFSASGCSLTEMCRSPNGTTTCWLLMRCPALQNCNFKSLISASQAVASFCQNSTVQPPETVWLTVFPHMRSNLPSQATQCPAFNYASARKLNAPLWFIHFPLYLSQIKLVIWV